MKSCRFFAVLLAFLLLLGLSGCDFINNLMKDEEPPAELPPAPEVLEPVDPNWPVTVFGVEIDALPEKVAVASPALAEYISDMGLFDKVCGVSDFCNFGGASAKPGIGSVQLPNLEKIKELAPEYILTFSQYEESLLTQIQQMNITVITVEAPQSLDELKELYRQIAIFFNGAEDGVAFGDSYVAEYENLIKSAAYSGEKKTVGFIRSLDYMMITGSTMENELLSLLGFTNVAEAESGYNFPAEKIAEFDPEILFVNSHIHIIDFEESDIYKKKSAVKNDNIFGTDFDSVAICSKRSISLIKDMLATAYEDYTLGTALEPAYPSKYKQS